MGTVHRGRVRKGSTTRAGHTASHRARCRPPRAAQVADAPPESPAGPKVSLVSMGCPKNTVDSEVMLGHLHRSGFDIVEDHEDSDVIIVNTCTFVDDAKSESLDTIIAAAELRCQKEGKRLVVTGCMAQRYSDEMPPLMPEVDAIVGFEHYDRLPQVLHDVLGSDEAVFGDELNEHSVLPRIGGPAATVKTGTNTVPFRDESDRVRITPEHTAYLRIAEGCNHTCSFCAIPGFRGKFRSKAWSSVVEEAARLVGDGAKELCLIAEDSNQYGMDRRDGRGLAHVLHELGKLEGLHWIRILYAYPSYFSDELIDEIASNPKVCKYIDMPLQHISNLTLLAMNRPPRDHTEDLLKKLRQRIPDLALRTTFISGFPGESEAQHRELVDFCKQFRFERMGAFSYSEEEGTLANGLPDQVPVDVRIRRRDELVSLQQRIGEAWARSMVGKTVQVLVDGVDDEGVMIGRTQYDAPDIDNQVLLTDSDDATVPSLEAGQMRLVEITDHITFDLVGQPVQ